MTHEDLTRLRRDALSIVAEMVQHRLSGAAVTSVTFESPDRDESACVRGYVACPPTRRDR